VAELGTKDAAMQISGAWIIELSELDSISRRDVASVKAFISRPIDRFRRPYGRSVIEQSRQCVFAGTTNLSEYLRDETGGRRFWPIRCTTINIEALSAARDQLWAEAFRRYNAGEHWWLDTPELVAAAAEEQRARYQEDPWQALIAVRIQDKSEVSTTEILTDLFHIPPQDIDRGAEMRVGKCLHALGWQRKQIGSGPMRGKWRYIAPSNPP
jgi:predicted P-loop ATPase